MKRDDEMLLTNAVQELQVTELDAAQMTASARRVAERLGMDAVRDVSLAAIVNCGDVRMLLASHRAGTLSHTRSLFIESHLRDCSACLRQYRNGTANGGVDWSVPGRSKGKAPSLFAWRPQMVGWALAPCVALLVSAFFLYRAYWQVPPGVRAEVQSIDGPVYRSADGGDRLLARGDQPGSETHLTRPTNPRGGRAGHDGAVKKKRE